MAHGISNSDPTKSEVLDAPDVLDAKIEQLAEWIRNAKHFIVFTGEFNNEENLTQTADAFIA